MDYLLQSSKLMDLDPELDSVDHVMLEADFSILTVLLYFEFLFKDISTSVRFADAFIQIPPHLIQMYQERKSFLLIRCPDFGKL